MLIANLLDQLSQAERDSFYNLSHVGLPEDLPPAERTARLPLAIFETNAVAAGDGVGIFHRMARLNHGCSRAFNVVYSWREKEAALVVHALKPIKRGSVGILSVFFFYYNPHRIFSTLGIVDDLHEHETD